MKTLLIIEKKSGSGRIVERRRQIVKSFTQNLMELLYLQHAQITYAAKRDVWDIRGGYVWSDAERYTGNFGRNQRANLLVTSPGGNSQVWVGGEASYNSSPVLDPPPQTLLPGELIGIQIGSGNTAVTPQDAKLANRISHGQRAPIVVATSLDSVLTGDGGGDNLDTSAYRGFYWIPNRQMTVSSIKLLLYRSGTPGTLSYHFKPAHMKNGTVNPPDIYSFNVLATASTNGDTLPTGAPYEWREFVLSTPVIVVPGMGYVFWGIKSGSGSAYRRIITSSNSAYSNPRTLESPGGTYWYNNSPIYDIIGTTPREIEYGPCEVSGLKVTNPTAEFIIRRLFTNNSGGNITVEECGIYAGCSWHPEYGSSFPLCICRDVIAPAITVADGEVLAITYTPQITV
jgi:hypothetical protein